MARQRTRKSAAKRIMVSNPKGNRKAKTLINQSGRHHLKTKRSTRSKRRKLARVSLNGIQAQSFEKKVVNM